MLRNYIKIAWRNLVKGKLCSLINIVGLAAGISCCLLISLYVVEELRFDRFHEKADQIYRVNTKLINKDQTSIYAISPPPLTQYLEDNYPEVEQVVSLQKEPGVIRFNNQLFERNFLVTSPSFFNMFDFQVLRGYPGQSLLSPNEVLLTRKAAENFYGNSDVVGRPIELRIDTTYYQATIAGVVEDPPQYSSIQFEILVPQNLWNRADPNSDRGNNWATLSGVRYALLNPKVSAKSLGDQVTADLKKQVDDTYATGKSIEFQPLTSVHLGGNVQYGLEPTANTSFINIAILIAVLILIIACINFTSLSIGQSAQRAREVGMRKTMGAKRNQLVAQFMGETLLIVLCSFGVALLLTELLLPHFGSLVNRSLDLNISENPLLLGLVVGILFLTGLLAGSYPALYLSTFSPSQIFQHKIKVRGNYTLISLLTGLQFSLVAILIVGTILMNRQMDLMLNSNPGYKTEYVIQIDAPFEEGRNIMERLRVRLGNESSITGISGGWNGLAGEGSEFSNNPISTQDQEIRGATFGMDPALPELLDLRLVEGRFFRAGTNLSSPDEVLVNEEFVNTLGWEEPLGKTVSRMFNFSDATIVGVVENFHYQSMHHSIGPLVMYPNNYVLSIYAGIQANSTGSALNRIEEAWQAAAPGIPFNYQFLDDQIEQQYRADQRWVSIVKMASILVIVISCMGLFGLAALASVKRTKEIAVRKIMGATVTGVTTTLTKDFLKPVVAGLIVAFPIAYLLLNRWLANFAYRVEMGVESYVLAGVLTLVVAIGAVGWQAIRAALANPVDSLRSE